MIAVQLRDGEAVAEVTFTAGINGLPGPICVVGDFNDWDPYAHQMPSRGDTCRVTINLALGRRYVFQYLPSEGHWFNDEDAEYELNEFGGIDSVLDLRIPWRAQEAHPSCSESPALNGGQHHGH